MQETPSELAEVFDSMIRYYDSVENHFDEVILMLRDFQSIGKEHVLYKDWTSLRERWYDTRTDARVFARTLSELLRYGRDDLATRMRNSSTLEVKRIHLDKFVQDLRKQEEDIVRTIKIFCTIGQEIGVLSARIRGTLRGKGMGGFFKKILTYLAWFATYVIDLFDAVGKVVHNHYFTNRLWSDPSLLSSLIRALKDAKAQNPTPGQVATEAQRNAEEMLRMLEAYQRAFDEWRMRCNMLAQIIDDLKTLPQRELVLELVVGTIVGTTNGMNCDSLMLATCLDNFSKDRIVFPE